MHERLTDEGERWAQADDPDDWPPTCFGCGREIWIQLKREAGFFKYDWTCTDGFEFRCIENCRGGNTPIFDRKERLSDDYDGDASMPLVGLQP